jgi:hypothetical protein
LKEERCSYLPILVVYPHLEKCKRLAKRKEQEVKKCGKATKK